MADPLSAAIADTVTTNRRGRVAARAGIAQRRANRPASCIGAARRPVVIGIGLIETRIVGRRIDPVQAVLMRRRVDSANDVRRNGCAAGHDQRRAVATPRQEFTSVRPGGGSPMSTRVHVVPSKSQVSFATVLSVLPPPNNTRRLRSGLHSNDGRVRACGTVAGCACVQFVPSHSHVSAYRRPGSWSF